MHPVINFLSSHRQPKKRFSLKWVILLFGSGFLLIFFWTLFFGFKTIYFALEGKQAAAKAYDSLAFMQIDLGKEHIKEAAYSFQVATSSFEKLSFFSWIPGLEDLYKNGYDFLLVTQTAIKALQQPLNLMVDLGRFLQDEDNSLQSLFQNLSPSQTIGSLPQEKKQLILKRFSAASGDLQATLAQIDLLLQTSSLHIQKNKTSLFYPLWSSLRTQLVRLRTELVPVALFAQFVPHFAGIENPQNFLLLFLNNQELRPGGGFIGSYGIVTIENGEIKELYTLDSYTLDNLVSHNFSEEPPKPLQEYNATHTWFVRDANWSPDFAISSQEVLRLFYKEQAALQTTHEVLSQPRTFAGVIGLTPTFVSDILSLTGSLEVDGQIFTAENIAEAMEYQVEKAYEEKGIHPLQRKEILGRAVEQVRDKLMALPFSKWKEVGIAIEKALQEKQLILYHENQMFQDRLTQLGLAGRMIPNDFDYLAVVDANLASLKTDPVVERTLTYKVEMKNNKPIATVRMHYNHTGSFDWKTTRYRTYVRFYVPKGSIFIENSSSHLSPVEEWRELGFMVFGTFVSIEPGKSNEVVLSYELPERITQSLLNGTYNLSVFKQIGTNNYPLTLDLDFDKDVRRASPPEEQINWGDDQYVLNTILDQDKSIQIGF